MSLQGAPREPRRTVGEPAACAWRGGFAACAQSCRVVVVMPEVVVVVVVTVVVMCRWSRARWGQSPQQEGPGLWEPGPSFRARCPVDPDPVSGGHFLGTKSEPAK